MGLFSKSEPKDPASFPNLQAPAPCAIADMFDCEPIYSVNAVGANLFVYSNCVVIDHTKGGFMNLGNRTYKIIPIKNIMAVQVKRTGATTGFIEFSTPGHEATEKQGFDRVNDENTVNFANDASAAVVNRIVRYLLTKIL